jgi:uncharacterized protein
MDIQDKEIIDTKLIAYQLRNLRQITFEVTERCNLKCKYCGYGDFYGNYDTRDTKELPIKKASLFLNYIINYWKENPAISHDKYIYIGFYGGEPLLNMGLIKYVINYLKKIVIPYKEFQFNMTTNAMLLDKHMDYLVENNIKLLISLDGNAYNHSYRVDHSGKNSFERILANIEMLREKYSSFFTLNVNFNAVLHNRNSVAETYDFIRNKFNKQPSMNELNASGVKPEKQQSFWETYKNKDESLHNAENYYELSKDLFLESTETMRLTKFIHEYSGNVFNTYNDLFIDRDKIEAIPTGTCLPFGKKVFITVNGKILPCERIGHNYVLGEITDKEVLIDFDKIAYRYNNWYQKFLIQCSKCYNKRGCPKCMFTVPDLDTTAVCNGFMNKESYEHTEKLHMNYLKNNPELYKRIMEEVVIKP